MRVWDVCMCPAVPNQENVKITTSRPVIVIEEFTDEVQVIPITTQLNQKSKYKNSFIVTAESFEGKEMGLIHDSLIIVDRKPLIRKIFLDRIIGTCPQTIIDKIKTLLDSQK